MNIPTPAQQKIFEAFHQARDEFWNTRSRKTEPDHPWDDILRHYEDWAGYRPSYSPGDDYDAIWHQVVTIRLLTIHTPLAPFG